MAVAGERMNGPSATLLRPTASWVVKEKGTGAILFETFNARVVAALNTARYEAVPILDHLASLNR